MCSRERLDAALMPEQSTRTSAASKQSIFCEHLRTCGFACWMLDVFRRVEIENLSALSRTWVDGADVLTSLHFPDCGDDAVFFNGLVRNLFF